MICPHCGIGTSPNFGMTKIGDEESRHVQAATGNCTECARIIIFGEWVDFAPGGPTLEKRQMLYPGGPQLRPIAPEVDANYARDFQEASVVLALSPKASAALSRRLLQHTIREQAGIKGRSLDAEIKAVIDSGRLASDLAEDLDMIRTIGNFAAHPIKSTDTGQVVDVEPGEAEALLDLLEQLFDQYFVRPTRRAANRATINAKLAQAGKPSLKGTIERASVADSDSGTTPPGESPPDAPPVLS